MLDDALYKIIVDSMSAHVAILNEQGKIVETNRAWQTFASENGMKESSDSIGMNYLAICERQILPTVEKTGRLEELVTAATTAMETQLEVTGVYGLAADAIINGNVAEAKREIRALRGKAVERTVRAVVTEPGSR